MTGLENRTARCHCGRTEPSNVKLAFFEYRGEGSRQATESCAHCPYNSTAHERARDITQTHLAQLREHEFESHGAFEYDGFYCGCNGWD